MKLVKEKNPGKRLTAEQRKAGVGKGFIYHKSSQPFYGMEVVIKNLETDPELYISHSHNYVYKIPWLIHFLKILESIKNGKIMIHGGAVTKNFNDGIIITGQSDAGKTTLVFLLAKQGYSILGDDKINLSAKGEISRYEDDLGLYPHPDNLKDLPLTSKQKILGWLKYQTTKFGFITNRINPNLRVKYHQIGEVADTAQLEKVFIIERGKLDIRAINKSTAIRKILATSLRLLMPEGFPKALFYKYCFVNKIEPTFITDRARSILDRALEDKKIFLVTGENYKDFYDLIQQQISATQS